EDDGTSTRLDNFCGSCCHVVAATTTKLPPFHELFTSSCGGRCRNKNGDGDGAVVHLFGLDERRKVRLLGIFIFHFNWVF
ncbi:hypothetical protein A2U01_0064565, partial [Trifolium medium]|nr:hypothetical protein [Trifolium medium]